MVSFLFPLIMESMNFVTRNKFPSINKRLKQILSRMPTFIRSYCPCPFILNDSTFHQATRRLGVVLKYLYTSIANWKIKATMNISTRVSIPSLSDKWPEQSWNLKFLEKFVMIHNLLSCIEEYFVKLVCCWCQLFMNWFGNSIISYKLVFSLKRSRPISFPKQNFSGRSESSHTLLISYFSTGT